MLSLQVYERFIFGIYWGWENTHPAPVRSALELLRAVFSPHCSSPCTPTTEHLKTVLSSSWSFQMSPKSSASFRTVTSLLTDRRLRSWLSGAVLTTWSLTCSKLWRWAWTSGETPCSPPTHNHEKLCNYSGVIQIPGLHNFSGPEVGQSHWVHGEKGPAEDVLPLKKIRKQKNRKLRRVVRTAERIIGTPPPPPLSKNCAYPEWAKGLVKSLWTLTSSTLTLWTVTVWSTLQSSEHQKTRHRNSFFPQAIHLMNTWQ